MDDFSERVHEIERSTRENAVAIERAASDARNARDAVSEFLPIVRQRSGDEQRRERFELNVNQAHDKVRGLAERLEVLERWKDRAIWTGTLIMFVGGVLAWFIDRLLSHVKGG